MRNEDKKEIIMKGIDLEYPVLYKYASFRFMEKGEHHISRFCRENVLLLVYEGTLRFSENGRAQEVCAGEYYIQKKNSEQSGETVSDAPKYLYVHFDAEWTDAPDALPQRGSFHYATLSELMDRIDTASHGNSLYSEKQYLLLKLLLSLYIKPKSESVAQKISEYIEENIDRELSLSDLCNVFHYSKNYIIRIFRKEFGMPPFEYINELKIKRSMYLLETTSRPIEEIARECGYSNYSYFYRSFVKRTGTSPIQWRREIQKNPLLK